MEKRNIKYIIDEIISAILLIVFIFWMCIAFLTEESKGHYEKTKAMQPDGNYYIWVEEWGDYVKGYYVPNGYMGYVEGKYILFASESEYYEYMKECD